ncbi:hypothetical protein KR009_011921, partial [Drosophila setifemur]
MTGKLLLATILCLMGSGALGQILEGNYNVTAFCTAMKTGTQLGSIVSCDYYYVCGASGPVKTSCQTNYAYNYTVQACQPAGVANCYYGVENPCAGKTETWVPLTGTCNGYTYCLNGQTNGTGTCKAGTKFDSVSGGCVYGSCTNVVVESEEPNLANICEVVPPKIYFGDTQNCNKWNFCTPAGVLQSATCPTDTPYFNTEKVMCGYNTPSVCNRVTDVPLGTATGACTTNGEVKGDSAVCGQYYVCTNKQWQVTACAYGYYFDVPTKACVSRQLATPTAGCNRCQYASTMFVNDVDSSTCQEYAYCNSGKAVQTEGCNAGLFFNEDRQGCVSDTDLPTYVLNHGACLGATASGGTTSDSTGSTAS